LFLNKVSISKTQFYTNFLKFNVPVEENKQLDKITNFDLMLHVVGRNGGVNTLRHAPEPPGLSSRPIPSRVIVVLSEKNDQSCFCQFLALKYSLQIVYASSNDDCSARNRPRVSLELSGNEGSRYVFKILRACL
jgi:hypothetical protein